MLEVSCYSEINILSHFRNSPIISFCFILINSKCQASVNIRPAESLYSAYMTRRMLLFDPQHPVPDSDMGLYIPGGAGTLLQLFPQTVYIHA